LNQKPWLTLITQSAEAPCNATMMAGGAHVSEHASSGHKNRRVRQDETYRLARSETCAPAHGHCVWARRERPLRNKMDEWFAVQNAEEVPSPALLVYPNRVRENIRRMIRIAGDPSRLRPHIKTHKLPEI